MKIITCYTDSHIPLLERHYLPSLPEGFEAELIHLPQECPSGEYMSEGWTKTVRRKLAAIVSECMFGSKRFLVVDADVRFYGLDPDALETCVDVKAQDDGAAGLCTGFMLVTPGEGSRGIFSRACDSILDFGDDQLAVNGILREGVSRTATSRFSDEIVWNYGAQLRAHSEPPRVWETGMPLEPPPGMLVHHASWTKGIANKLAMLDEVKKIHEARRT